MDLNCADIVRYDDRLFLLTRDTQYLFEYFPVSEEISICGTVRNKLGQLFTSMTVCGDELYIAPYNADNYCIYDIKKKKLRRVFLDDKKNEGNKKQYKICFSYQRKVYFLGGRETVMLCIDADTGAVEEIKIWNEEFKKKYGHETWIRTHQHVCIVDHCFWVALEGKNVLLQYNMLTKEYNFWNVGTRKIQYVTVSYDGEYFWLSGEEKVIVRWKKETNSIMEFESFPDGFEAGRRKFGWKELFGCGYIWNDSIYFTPSNANMLIKFDRISNQMSCILEVDINYVCFTIIEISDKELYIEEDKAENLIFNQAYLISAADGHKKKSIQIEENKVLNKDLAVEYLKMEGGIIAEGFPQCVLKLYDMIRNEEALNMDIRHTGIGKKVWKNLV